MVHSGTRLQYIALFNTGLISVTILKCLLLTLFNKQAQKRSASNKELETGEIVESSKRL